MLRAEDVSGAVVWAADSSSWLSQGWRHLARAACPCSRCGAGEGTSLWGGWGWQECCAVPSLSSKKAVPRRSYSASGHGQLTQVMVTGLPPRGRWPR